MTQRVLLCDDDVLAIRAAEQELKHAGYEVRVAVDGENAWQAIRDSKPDVLVTHCHMPHLDGLGLVQRVRDFPDTHDLPILMLAGTGFDFSLDELAAKWRIVTVIPKPFTPQTLLRVLTAVFCEEPATATQC
jgi:CheY-like chemotaxis protein